MYCFSFSFFYGGKFTKFSPPRMEGDSRRERGFLCYSGVVV